MIDRGMQARELSSGGECLSLAAMSRLPDRIEIA
jgi:hypothetical protein